LLFRNKAVTVSTDLQKQSRPLAIRSVLLLLGFLGCIFFFGYYLSAFLFIVTILWVLNYRKPFITASVASIFLILIYFLFEIALNINLPNGIWL
jgi:hypothetical protein